MKAMAPAKRRRDANLPSYTLSQKMSLLCHAISMTQMNRL